MEHLTALAAGFLEVEDSDTTCEPGDRQRGDHRGAGPELRRVSSRPSSERVPTIPRCRQVLRTHPLDLRLTRMGGRPALRYLAPPAPSSPCRHPGGDAELFQMVATMMERRLDRERPLWECWVIEGLSDNRWAVLTKIHHCIADGIATTQMLAKFSDERRRRHLRQRHSRREGAGPAWAASAEDEPEPVELGERDGAQRARRGGRRRTRGGGCGRTDGQSAQPGARIVADRTR